MLSFVSVRHPLVLERLLVIEGFLESHDALDLVALVEQQHKDQQRYLRERAGSNEADR